MYNCAHRSTFDLIKSAIVGKKAMIAERLYRKYKREEEFEMLPRANSIMTLLRSLAFILATEKCFAFSGREFLNYNKARRERMSEQ